MAEQCSVCDSKNLQKRRIGTTELFYCNSCTVCFNANLASSATIDEYYRSAYILKNHNETAELLTSERRRIARLPEQLSLIADIQRRLPPPAHVLDIGCDKGFFLDEIRRYGYTVQGIELSERGRAGCEKIQIPVLASMDDVPEHSAQCISLWHVLEHIPQPQPFLLQLHSLLDDNGILMIRVPDFSSIWRKVFGKYWIWFQPQNHYVHYTPKSLKILLENSGFIVHSCTSRRAGNALTRAMFAVARRMFSESMELNTSLRTYIGRIVETVAGIEIYVQAQKKEQ